MRYTSTPFKLVLFLVYFITNSPGYTIQSSLLEKQADSTIKELYHTLNSIPMNSMEDRIRWISSQFLGKKYILGALGEGPDAQYDQFPRYRVDAFDCDTYVNTVLALALAHSLKTFQICMQLNRYQDGKVAYLHRNHFTSVDWNKNNQNRGILKDITLSIKDKHNQPVAKIAEAIIDKPNWYKYKTLSTIRLNHANKEKQHALLNELKRKGRQLEIVHSKLPYLPLNALFFDNSKPNMYLFSQIPDGAIIEIVRPNWDLRQQIGTALNVSHLGFVLRNEGRLVFREASSTGKVIDVLLIDYLREALKSPTIKGINIQVIVPKKPLGSLCTP